MPQVSLLNLWHLTACLFDKSDGTRAGALSLHTEDLFEPMERAQGTWGGHLAHDVASLDPQMYPDRPAWQTKPTVTSSPGVQPIEERDEKSKTYTPAMLRCVMRKRPAVLAMPSTAAFLANG